MSRILGIGQPLSLEPRPVHFAIIAAAAAFFYLSIQASNFVMLPRINIASREFESGVTRDHVIEIRGRVRGGVGLEINGNKIKLDNRGNFIFQLPLARGLNLIDFSSKNRLGRERKITREIVYEPE